MAGRWAEERAKRDKETARLERRILAMLKSSAGDSQTALNSDSACMMEKPCIENRFAGFAAGDDLLFVSMPDEVIQNSTLLFPAHCPMRTLGPALECGDGCCRSSDLIMVSHLTKATSFIVNAEEYFSMYNI